MTNPELLSRRRFLVGAGAALAGAVLACGHGGESARRAFEGFPETSPATGPTYEPTPDTLSGLKATYEASNKDQTVYLVSGSEVLGDPNANCYELFLVAATVFCHFSEINQRLIIPPTENIPDHILKYVGASGTTIPLVVKALNDCFGGGPQNREWQWPKELKKEESNTDPYDYSDEYARPGPQREKNFWDDWYNKKSLMAIPVPDPVIYRSPAPGQNGPTSLENYYQTEAVPSLRENSRVFNLIVGGEAAAGLAISAAPEVGTLLLPTALQNPQLLSNVYQGLVEATVSP